MAEERRLKSGRRRFLYALGSGAAVTGLAGCTDGGGDGGDGYGGDDDDNGSDDSGNDDSGSDDDNSGDGSNDLGTVIYTVNAELTEYDPSTNFDVTSLALSNVYEPLVWHNLDGNQETHPGLAKDWSVSEDGLDWTFDLREGVTFHNGGEMTAEDVKFSLERTMEMGQGPAFIWGPVDKIEVDDDYTVSISLSSKAPLDLIASSQYGAWIFSKEEVESHGDTPEAQAEWFQQGNEAGTGPYTIGNWERSSQLELSKFDDYWGGWEGDHYSGAQLKIVNEASTNIQLLQNGDVDILRNAPYSQLSSLENDDAIDITQDTSFMQLYGLMHVEKEPTDDIHVRKAIRHAFPYEQGVENILAGYGETNGSVIPNNMWGDNTDLEVPEFDLDVARDHLEQSKYDPSEMSLQFNFSSGHNTWRRALLFLQENLKEIGVGEVNVDSLPSSTYFEQARNIDTAPNMTLFWWWPTYVTPYDYLYSMFHCAGENPIYSLSYWCNEDFDAKINEGRQLSATDRDQAIELFQEAQATIEEEALAVNFWQLQTVKPHLADLSGYDPNPSYTDVVFFRDLDA
ncbi:ABC transporter substrate-binding protein [Halobacterium wangiae]|uniref:ABC transporter substrate-binding protein n=1 Tax=Halobacterium wangiae TaxID=2902623 RepID=UPI001E62E3AF|nr:ABC transporter substrate-binding protein [Halobacterium wangiae]